jgi:hypothetical protein
MASYRVIVHPYRQHQPGPPPGGPWLIRCYTDDGEHVHSAEGGVSLSGGLDEVKRAIEEREATLNASPPWGRVKASSEKGTSHG